MRTREKLELWDGLIREALCFENMEMIAPSIGDVGEESMPIHDHGQCPAGIAMRGNVIAQTGIAFGLPHKLAELCIGWIFRIRHGGRYSSEVADVGVWGGSMKNISNVGVSHSNVGFQDVVVLRGFE